MAMMRMIRSCQGRFTPNRGNVPLTSGFTARETVGLQIRMAAPIRINSRPRVTMIGRSADAPYMRRMNTRSTKAPSTGAPTSRMITNDRATGTWWAWSSQ